jgi:tritrans,polycis-undecaprenyl-diphosphate synthase [geranylgeranyl-diphosphate specific]
VKEVNPSHIAIIPDGNRRWAKQHGKSLVEGYLAGIDRASNALEWSRDLNVKELTFWGLSTENLSRDKNEIKVLMHLFELKFREVVKRNEFHENGIRFRAFGNTSVLSEGIQKYISSLEESTRDYSDYFVNLLLGYGGRQEILAACNSALADYQAGKIKKVDEKTFSSYLYTANLADPDLIIRTSGEQRLSGFLPWQSAYSEFYFSKYLWPDFTKQEMGNAIEDYGERKRRFGR